MLPLLPKNEPEWNVVALQDKIDSVRKYPLTDKDCFYYSEYKGRLFWVDKEMMAVEQRFIDEHPIGISR